MFERFTPEARRIVTGGVEIAQHLHHDFLGTEHLLIALADTGPNVAIPRALGRTSSGSSVPCGTIWIRQMPSRSARSASTSTRSAREPRPRSGRVRWSAVVGGTVADACASAACRSCRRPSRRSSSPSAKRSGWVNVRSDPNTYSSGCSDSMRCRPSSSTPSASTPAGSALRSSEVSATSVDAEREPAALAGVGPVALGSGHGVPHEAARRR